MVTDSKIGEIRITMDKQDKNEKVLETAAEKALVQEVIDHMCENVVRIAEVSLLWYSLQISILVFYYWT